MENLTIILIALSISTDAFSLAIAYGLLDIKKTKLFISLLVGTFHFVMPIIGMYFGNFFVEKISINLKYIVAGIFLILLLQMIKSIDEEKENYQLNLYNIFLFAFFVSIDSFSIGIGLKYITTNPIKACAIFSLFSAFFTYLGFSLGKLISKRVGKLSKIIGIVLLAFLFVYYICK